MFNPVSFHQQNGRLHCIEKWENILIIYYACPTAHDIEKLEKVLLSSARIVTGLPILHLENPFIQKQVGKLYKTDDDYNVQNLQWLCPTLLK